MTDGWSWWAAAPGELMFTAAACWLITWRLHTKTRRPHRPCCNRRTERYCSWAEVGGFQGLGPERVVCCNLSVTGRLTVKRLLIKHRPLATESLVQDRLILYFVIQVSTYFGSVPNKDPLIGMASCFILWWNKLIFGPSRSRTRFMSMCCWINW